MQEFENDDDMLSEFKTIDIFHYVFSTFIISIRLFVL